MSPSIELHQQNMPWNYSVEYHPLTPPSLIETALVLQTALSLNFAEVQVAVEPCPDLTKPPFGLTRPGLSGGQQVILDVGSTSYFFPKPHLQRRYDFTSLAEKLKILGHAIIGAGAGPYHQLHRNSEMVANTFVPSPNDSAPIKNECRYILTNASSAKTTSNKDIFVHKFSELDQMPRTEFILLGNFYVCRGDPGDIISIRVKNRVGKQTDFTACIRDALKNHYGNQTVALGGVFAMLNGSALLHVMPDFPERPLANSAELDKWLKFFTVPAPLVFASEIVSRDPNLDLRVQHAHGYGPHGGGHYHNDAGNAEIVEYIAFYNVAHGLYRIDRPPASNGTQVHHK